AAALDGEATEVRRGRAEGQTLLVSVQLPPAIDQIDGGLRVLDQGPVLNELADRIAALDVDDRDVFERALAGERVRADPERRPITGEPLMDDVLDVGGGTRDPLENARGIRKRIVGRLRHRDPLMPGL